MTTKPSATLECHISESIADYYVNGKVLVFDRRDLAQRAALDGFREGVAMARQVAAEMCDHHDCELLREAERQIRTLPGDLA